MSDRIGEIRSTRAPTLREDQIEILKRYGQTRKTEVGDVLFRAGDTSNDLLPADGYSHPRVMRRRCRPRYERHPGRLRS